MQILFALFKIISENYQNVMSVNEDGEVEVPAHLPEIEQLQLSILLVDLLGRAGWKMSANLRSLSEEVWGKLHPATTDCNQLFSVMANAAWELDLPGVNAYLDQRGFQPTQPSVRTGTGGGPNAACMFGRLFARCMHHSPYLKHACLLLRHV